MLHVRDLLEYLMLDYKAGGKNVARQDINIDCPYCGAEKHLAIHAEKGIPHCWVCEFIGVSPKPRLERILADLTSLPLQEVRAAIIQHRDSWLSKEEEAPTIDETLLPDNCYRFEDEDSGKNFESAFLYLKKRKISIDKILRWDIRYTDIGEDITSNRIIFPVYFKGELVSWVGRDLSKEEWRSRYYNCPRENSTKELKETLYGFDKYPKGSKTLILVEGIFDKLNLMDNALGLYKASLSESQLDLVIELDPEEVVLMLDNDAYYRKGYPIAKELSTYFPVKNIHLPKGKDPADLSTPYLLHLISKTRYFMP